MVRTDPAHFRVHSMIAHATTTGGDLLFNYSKVGWLCKGHLWRDTISARYLGCYRATERFKYLLLDTTAASFPSLLRDASFSRRLLSCFDIAGASLVIRKIIMTPANVFRVALQRDF